MRYALISDIHGNLPALEAVLNSIAGRSDIAATYHLGDLVGYGPWPNETISLLKGFRVVGIQGNHDATIGLAMADALAPVGRGPTHTEWTARETTEANKALLAQLPFRMDLRPGGGHDAGPTVILLHGTPEGSERYWFADEPQTFFREMTRLAGARAGDVICCGHTHLPWHRELDGIHFVNTGSVGRPKDGDWRAGYVVVTVGDGKPTVEFVRVEYDVESTAAAIRASELPDELAEYLLRGGEQKAPI